MKNLLLPVLCWFLAANAAFSQKTLSPAAVEHSYALKPEAKKMMRQAGFDLPGADAWKNRDRHTPFHGEPLYLDSMVAFNGYPAPVPNDSIRDFRVTYTYPRKDVAVQIEWDFENGAWVPVNQVTFVYDDRNRLVDNFAARFDPDLKEYILDSRLEFFPHGSSPSLLDSILVSAWDPAQKAWSRIMTTENRFDTLDRIGSSLTTIEILGMTFRFRDDYEYDKDGNNAAIRSYQLEDQTELLTAVVEKAYDDNRLVTETRLIADGLGNLEPQSLIEYENILPGTGEAVSSYQWNPDENDWMLVKTETFEYDAQRRLESKTTLLKNPEGGEDEFERIAYAYLRDTFPALETRYLFDFDDNAFVLMDKKYYYYKGVVAATDDQPIPVLTLALSPNPTERFVQFHVEGMTIVRVFDANGLLVRSLRDDTTPLRVDLGGLPAGMYTIHALSNGAVYTGKVIKQ